MNVISKNVPVLISWKQDEGRKPPAWAIAGWDLLHQRLAPLFPSFFVSQQFSKRWKGSLEVPVTPYLLTTARTADPKKEAGRRIWRRKVTHTHTTQHIVHNFRRRSIDFPASAALDLTNRNCAADAKILKSSPGKESFGFFSFCRWCTYLQRVLLFKKEACDICCCCCRLQRA